MEHYTKIASVTVGDDVGAVVALWGSSPTLIYHNGEFYKNAIAWMNRTPI